MLDPSERRLLFECLRPPEGWQLDYGVATTFSLDLLTLLTLPLAFTLFDWEDKEGGPTADPHALLEALRRYASRLSIFCQAGQIHVPPPGRLLLGYLEESVHESVAPAGGAFHAKITVLRFVPHGDEAHPSESTDQEPVRYRVLCATRNLTFDRAWDAVLSLDGCVKRRQRAYSMNRPLSEFVVALDSMAIHSLIARRREKLAQIGDELLRVEFETPEDLQEFRFWPIGHNGRRAWPFTGRIDRLLITAPFLADETVSRLAKGREDQTLLVSRIEALEQLAPNTLSSIANAYYMDPAVDAAESDLADISTVTTEDQTPDPLQHGLRGLHAKVYVADAGWNSRVWVGSANATNAAFTRNVEFLVELVGRKSDMGIDALLGRSHGDDEPAPEKSCFGDLLREYRRGDRCNPVDPIERQLDALTLRVRQQLAGLGLAAHIQALDSEGTTLSVTIGRSGGDPVSLPEGTQVRCWPASLPDTAAHEARFEPGQPVTVFPRLTFKALTAFFGFEVTVQVDARKRTTRFALALPLHGAPADRHSRLLLSLLENKRDVLRYLAMLLAEDRFELASMMRLVAATSGDQGHDVGAHVGIPLLERMLRTLQREPSRLDQIAVLIDDLQRTPEGRALLPERIDEVWPAIWECRRGAKTQ